MASISVRGDDVATLTTLDAAETAHLAPQPEHLAPVAAPLPASEAQHATPEIEPRDHDESLRAPDWKRHRTTTIAGVHIDSLHFDAVVETIVEHILTAREPGYVVTPNAHHVALYQSDALLRGIYEQAFLVVPDGVPLLWAAKLLRMPLNGRVNGTDLMEALCERAAEIGLRVFFLGGREGAAIAAVSCLTERHPDLLVCGTYCPPFGFENDPVENLKVIAAIRDAQPHILFVGLGAPKQEYWMFRYHQHLEVPVSLGVGCSFEFVGGIVARSPHWMQRHGLEWFHRLGSEPKRLWKRYLFTNLLFCVLVAWQLAGLAFGGRRQSPRATADRLSE